MGEEKSQKERERQIGFMREALNMAQLSLASLETPVGCVFVHNNIIIGRGMNATNRSYNGTRHAEFLAINDILTQTSTSATSTHQRKYTPEILKECDLYVTVEPCIMCASLLRQFGVRKVFYGAGNEKFGGTGGVLDIHVANGADLDPLIDSGEPTGVQDEQWEVERRAEDYEVSGGWLREEAIVLLRRFYVQENGRAPEPRRKNERVLKLEVEPLVDGAV